MTLCARYKHKERNRSCRSSLVTLVSNIMISIRTGNDLKTVSFINEILENAVFVCLSRYSSLWVPPTMKTTECSAMKQCSFSVKSCLMQNVLKCFLFLFFKNIVRELKR